MATTDPLAQYQARRDFHRSPEPEAGSLRSAQGQALSFVVQKHAARSLHYDFRLELGGTLKSWAIPKGPSLDPAQKRMAVRVEDHPLDYAAFEGTIPPHQYGAGDVIVWDRGEWTPVGDPVAGLENGKLSFSLHGQKLKGGWALVRMRGRGAKSREGQEPWLLVKEQDPDARPGPDFDVTRAWPDSVLTGRPLPAPAAPVHSAAPAAKPAPRNARPPAAKTALPAPAAPVKSSTSGPLPKSVRITHGERWVDPGTGVTKRQLVEYYAAVAPLMLPHLKNRPVALLRAPSGIGGTQFFQKHAAALSIPGLKLLDRRLDPGHAPLLEIPSATALRGAAQFNAVEFHTWNAASDALHKPDRMTFDLDPGEGVSWVEMQEGAQQVRMLLEELGLAAFLKTSGGKGLHVVVPLRRTHDVGVVKDFSHAVVDHLVSALPQRFAGKSGAENRIGRIFADYLRNGFGATTVAAWSARARPGLGVSVPLAWDELAAVSSGAHWTVQNVGSRLAMGNAPWSAYAASRKGLAAAMKKLHFQPAA
ncbi:MAG: ATP-dependent ligase LigD polymerase module / ATP-dependent ligase LigD phosphoesterase [Polaromonas sp.]|nr:ATP-dependent ligase LigD polymerase module / ATP-dependent ligase LigD phosphoesterase [Polaromonas sp.]